MGLGEKSNSYAYRNDKIRARRAECLSGKIWLVGCRLARLMRGVEHGVTKVYITHIIGLLLADVY